MNRTRVFLAVLSLGVLACVQAPVKAPKGSWSNQWAWCDPYSFDTGTGGYPPTLLCDGGPAVAATAPAAAPAPVAAAPAPKPAPAPERKPASPPAAATFQPPAGTFSSAQRVALASETPGAAIHYTTDGSTPTASSPRYTGPIELQKNAKVRAVVIAQGAAPSDVTEAQYVIAPPPPVSSARVKVTEKKLELLEKVYFDTGKTTIKKASLPLLDEVAGVLSANPGVKKVVVEGHTDDVGAPATNLKLSEGRAAAVRDYLAKKGVAADRLEAKGFGETRPIADNKTPAGRDANRRVEFVIP